MGCIKMSTQHLNSPIIAGYPQEDTTLIKLAGERITNARKIFGNLCGDDKGTSRRGGSIGRTLEKYIASLGLDQGKDEDINTLCNTVGKAQHKGAKAFRDLMQAWDDWESVVTKLEEIQRIRTKGLRHLQLCALGGQINRLGNN